MFRSRIYAARIYNARLFGGNEGGGPRQSKGRRLARWVINAPWIPSPVAEWVRQRDDDEILFLG